MDNLDQKIELKERIIIFYKKNKLKIIFFNIGFLILISAIFFIKFFEEKKNVTASEKYIEAGIYLASNNEEKAKELYENIIKSKSKFYSYLSLNSILEKNLENDKEKVLTYFNIVENLKITKNQKDLISLKKALYLIKNSEIQVGKNLLIEISKSNSSYKSLADEILIDF